MSKFKWTQDAILAWSQRTFGIIGPKTVATRMNVEVAELLDALQNDNLEEAAKEVADVEIMLRQVAELICIDLDVEVEKKMGINERRKWKRTASGSYQHV